MSTVACFLVSRPARGGGMRAKYLGPELDRGPEILLKRHGHGCSVKMVGDP